jgi:tight adherence protein C
MELREFLILVLVFLFLLGLMLGGLAFFARRRRKLEQRLQTPAGNEDMLSTDPTLVLGDITPAMAAQIPISEEDQTELQRELRVAGFYRPSAMVEYLALRSLFVFLPLIIAGVYALYTESTTQALWAWGGGILVAILGFSVPRVYLYFRGQERMRQIERGMPTAIDMLTLCLGAGLNVPNSLARVVRELSGSFPVLAYELEIVRRQADLRSLEFALAQFADRVGLPHARNLSVILTQSENLGTDAVATLREYADNMRINMRQRADEMTNKVPFKLLFPAYLLAIGAAILILSPVVLEFAQFRRNNLIGGDITKAGADLKKADENFDVRRLAQDQVAARANVAAARARAREVLAGTKAEPATPSPGTTPQ